MNIKELEYFKTICEKKSITKAAHMLYMTPQGLSKIVKNLETELGTVLLNRTGSGTSLTETGAYLYEHLEDVLGAYQSICSEIRCIEQRQQHEIQLLSAYGILRLLTPDCLLDFQRRHPEIQLIYREYPDRQVERLFLEGEGNVALTVGDTMNRYLTTTPMDRHEIKLLVNKAHPLASRSSVAIADLEGEPMYLESSEFHIHEIIVQECEKAGFSPNIVFEASGFGLCHQMVAKNKGITVTMDFMYEDMRNDSQVLIPFENHNLFWEPHMLTRKGEQANPDVNVFHMHVLKWMQKIRDGEIER